MNDPCRELVLRLGKAQVDAIFERLDQGPIIDDAGFVPLVEAVLTAFETSGIDGQIVEAHWEHAYSQYDRYCKKADPSFTISENIHLMRSYLLGPRRINRRRR
jgi:hypothetical protein